jgi:hypothetical protein
MYKMNNLFILFIPKKQTRETWITNRRQNRQEIGHRDKKFNQTSRRGPKKEWTVNHYTVKGREKR